METLDDIQCIIDNGEVSPVIVMRDMNVQLPKAYLRGHRLVENGIKGIIEGGLKIEGGLCWKYTSGATYIRS